MAEPMIVTCNVGAVSNGLRPMFKVPSGFGGLTILSSSINQSAAGTSLDYLVDLGTAGTSTDGATLVTWGTTVYAANTPVGGTVSSSAYVEAGHYVGLKEGNTGAHAAECIVSLTAKLGK